MLKSFLRPIYFAIFVLVSSFLFIYEAFAAINLKYDFSFVGYGGTIKNHNIHVLGIPIYWFMMLCGLIIIIVYNINKRNSYHMSVLQSILISIGFLVFAYIGGKLLYVVENLNTVIQGGFSLDGLSLFGAIFFIPIVGLIYSGISRYPFSSLMDLSAQVGLIMLSFVRIGCFFSGCCGAITLWNSNNPIILPVQLFEVFFDLIILELCLNIEKKHLNQGYIYPFMMVSYGSCRFLLEFLRDSPKTIIIFSSSQIIAFVCLALGIVFIFLIKRNQFKK